MSVVVFRKKLHQFLARHCKSKVCEFDPTLSACIFVLLSVSFTLRFECFDKSKSSKSHPYLSISLIVGSFLMISYKHFHSEMTSTIN